ncbi:MAG TPA: type II toxin-antitoxin system RelE/ParE family toxin [Terriglobales bacterium]|jgi:plasmid stabilization system protein ParE|nr:type II toxin-antitoxin system RelE/ParE family toxin [Terriglobales bacterium]
MKSKPFRFHPEAQQEFRGSIRWYRDRSPSAAVDFRLEVATVIREILEAADRWPKYLYGTRRVVLRRFPFSIIYLDEPSAVILVAIAHGKRKPGYWKRRI